MENNDIENNDIENNDNENSNEENKIQEMQKNIDETKQAADGAAKLAANIASGNVLGAVKEGINLAKNEKVKKALKRKMIITAVQVLLIISIIVSICSVLFSIFDSIAERFGKIGNVQTTYVSNWKKIFMSPLFWNKSNDYWIDLTEKYEVTYKKDADTGKILSNEDILSTTNVEEVTEKMTILDQYTKKIYELGVSLQDLRILGDADYNVDDPLSDSTENSENKESAYKYIKAFVSADLMTSEIHKTKGASLIYEPSIPSKYDKKNSENAILANKIDGGIYLYRTKDVTDLDNIEDSDDNTENTQTDTKPTVDTTSKSINTSSYGLNAEEVSIKMDNITREYKIAWISDLHMMQPDEKDINEKWYADHSTTFKQRNNSFNNSYSILPKIIKCLNKNDFDAIVFGGDIMDNYSEDNFNYLKEQINKLTNKNVMFLVADHDYLTEMTTNSGTNKNASSLGVSGEIKQITIGENGDKITLVGQNYSNEKISDSAVNTINNYLNKSENSLFFTHVPIESKTQASDMQSWSRSVHNNEVYYWSSAATSSGYNNPSSNYLNTLYNSSTLKGVFAGHVHSSGDFELNNGIKEHIFSASYKNNIGVITLTPTGNVDERQEPEYATEDDKEEDIDNYYRMEYVDEETFNKNVDETKTYGQGDIEKLEKIFTIDEEDNIVIAKVSGKTEYKISESGSEYDRSEKYNVVTQRIPYKDKTQKFGMPYEFLLELCMITQNPEFVYHVAQMALNTRIDLVIANNEVTEHKETEKSKTEKNDDGTTTTTRWTEVKISKETTPEMFLKKANTWSKYQRTVIKNNVTRNEYSSTDDTEDKYTKVVIKNNYTSIEGKIFEKSDNFLGLLRNETGEYIEGTTPNFSIEGTKFDRSGINVKYKIPNRTIEEAPLNKLLSGEKELYELLAKNERTEPLIETMKYLLTFPEEDFEYFDDEEIEEILGIDIDKELGEIEEEIEEVEDIGATKNQKANAKEVYEFFIGKGFTPEAACGILGNIQKESSFVLSASNGSHFGLCQWGGGRYKNLVALAKKNGKSWTDLDTQLEFLWNELCGSEKATKQALTGCDSLLDATSNFCKLYERCGNYGTEIPKRYTYAKYWYNELVGKTDTDSNSNSDLNSDSNYDGTYTSKSGKKYKLYRQNYYKNTKYGNGTISSQGCNITSVAIALSAYGSNKNPAQLINGGSSTLVSTDGLLRQNGLNVTRVYGFKQNTIEIIQKNLEEGRPVVFNVNSNSSYTSNQHWMTLADIRTKDGVTEVYVLNPNKNGKEGWNKIYNVINQTSLKSYIIINK